jgi:pimeloyl-ACP methyl ester carboxylesterase
MPGLAANSKIFEYTSLPEDLFELHYLVWILPSSVDETIESYAKRMCEFIQEKNPVLIGVSFGGILVQEMSKIIQVQKVIIISSIKNNSELPKRLQLAKVTKTYKLFPTNHISNIESFISLVFSTMAQKRIAQYRMFLSVRDPLYLNWAIHHVLHWNQTETLSNVIHIHGTKDEIFPIKNISNCIEIEDGSHIMILNKGKKISTILINKLM